MKLALNGALGRMGQRILAMAAAEKDLEIAALVDAPCNAGTVVDTPWGPRTVLGDPAEVTGVDAGIDFSVPAAGLAFARSLAARGIPVVSCTTGMDSEHLAALRDAAAGAPILWAPNTSVGVHCLHELATMARTMLGPDYDVEIVEIHHRHKRDAPSGTALSLAGRLAETGLRPVLSREGDTGPRKADEMGVMALRGGEVVGEHTIYFLGDHDRIEITHRATSRDVFAQGALSLARRLVSFPPGLYRAADLLRQPSAPSS